MRPLTPDEAVAYFFSGEELAFTYDPSSPFFAGRIFNQLLLCTEIPFDNARAYFKAHPVLLYRNYRPPRPGVAAGAHLRFQLAGYNVRGDNMAVQLPIGNHVPLSVAFTDSAGDAAPKPGAVTWTATDPSIATLTPGASDDTTCDIAAAKIGVTTISATSGSITATIEIDVTAGNASQATITAGSVAPIGS